MALRIEGLKVGYDGKAVLGGVSLEVRSGEILALIGPTGCGKSTVLHAVFGLAHAEAGRIWFDATEITNRDPARNIAEGIVLVPQGGRVFVDLTVRENLEMGAYAVRALQEIAGRMERVFDFFPRLRERERQRAASLSGGERQMLALGIALMLSPRLLLLDEPSIGLSPLLTARVLEKVREIGRALGNAILIVEQNVQNAVAVGDRVAVLKAGRVMLTAPAGELLDQPGLLEAYLPQVSVR